MQGDSGNDDLDDFDQQMAADFAQADLDSGGYADAVQQLQGQAAQAAAAGTIAPADVQAYAQLLQVVREAASANLSQAQLKARILGLGDAAVRIAGSVRSLASVFS
ncbi:MAG TPA: hypothetical protein VF472_19110 [Burkholderiaceae bacterium]